MRTYKERLIAGLLALGWQEDKTAKGRYTTFTKTGHKKIFVGSNGALRQGRSASASRSMGCPASPGGFYRSVLSAAEALNKPVATPETNP